MLDQHFSEVSGLVARRLFAAMQDAAARRISPDDYRAIVRDVRGTYGVAVYEAAKVAAIIGMDRSGS